MNTYDVQIGIETFTRPGKTSRVPSENGAFAGVTNVDTYRYGPHSIINYIREDGWRQDSSASGRKLAKVELPEGVYAGEYKIDSLMTKGLYGDYENNDGMGKTVYYWCGESCKTDIGREAAIDKAIESGIYLSIPQKDGTRKIVKANVLAISEYFEGKYPDNWT